MIKMPDFLYFLFVGLDFCLNFDSNEKRTGIHFHNKPDNEELFCR